MLHGDPQLVIPPLVSIGFQRLVSPRSSLRSHQDNYYEPFKSNTHWAAVPLVYVSYSTASEALIVSILEGRNIYFRANVPRSQNLPARCLDFPISMHGIVPRTPVTAHICASSVASQCICYTPVTSINCGCSFALIQLRQTN